jgi:toxin ParE1/3/4
MVKLRLAKAAERDLASIRRYSEQRHGREQADAYLRSFFGAFARLREHPLIGSARPNLPGEIRGLSCGRHVVLYKVSGTDLLVVRIVHQSQDTPPAESLQ